MTARLQSSVDKVLAEKLGLAWQADGLVPADGVSFGLAIAAGIAPLDEGRSGFRIAITPSEAVLRLPDRHDLKGRTDVVVMPVSAFRSMLRGHARKTILDNASRELETNHPGQSAIHGMSPRQRVAGASLLALMVLCLLVQPQAALAILAVLTIPVFAALLVVRIGAAIDSWAPAAMPTLPIPNARLPIYTVLVPLYRETAVVDQLLAALLALDYPPSRLDIKILIEEGDAPMRHALAGRNLPDHIDVIMAPEGAPRTKPRALNIGLMEARGELLTIYDAEDRPDARQLRLSANLFARQSSDVACLQGHLVIDNADDSLLTRMFALEYAALFDVINPGLLHAGAPVLLGGTSNHFRTDILRQVGGWDAWNVTEDADLSFRLLRAGYRIADLPSATLEEAPVTLRPWFNQRVRWMKGFMQTMVTHTRQPRHLLTELGGKNAMILLSLCGGTLLSALSYPIFISATVASLTIHGLPAAGTVPEALIVGIWFTMFAGGLIALLAPVIIGAMHRGMTDLLWAAPLLPVYCLLVCAATFVAVIEYARAPSHWNKTDHGLARTSRHRRAAQPAGGTAPPASAPVTQPLAASL